MRLTRKPFESVGLALLCLGMLYYFTSSSARLSDPQPLAPEIRTSSDDTPFMPKMANETLKAELGNAAWKLFHTVLARYPDSPTTDQRVSLEKYIHYFAQLYPCGDCARHFAKLLEKNPPQTSSRQVAAVWGCHIHNKVNDRLGHPIYDCTHIIDDYDCGCGGDEEEEQKEKEAEKKNKEQLVDQHQYDFELKKEEKQHG